MNPLTIRSPNIAATVLIPARNNNTTGLKPKVDTLVSIKLINRRLRAWSTALGIREDGHAPISVSRTVVLDISRTPAEAGSADSGGVAGMFIMVACAKMPTAAVGLFHDVDSDLVGVALREGRVSWDAAEIVDHEG